MSELYESEQLTQLPVPPLVDAKPWAIVVTIGSPIVFGRYGTRGEAEIQMAWIKRHTLFDPVLRKDYES